MTDWVGSLDSIKGDLSEITKNKENNNVTTILTENMVRRIQYTVPIFIPLGPPSTICYIEQKVIKKEPGIIIISANHKTPNVPGGNH